MCARNPLRARIETEVETPQGVCRYRTGAEDDPHKQKDGKMNSKIKKIAGTGVSAVAVGVGMMAMTAAPSEAASSRGTIITAEAAKVHKAILRQHCVTVKEVRKIVHGKGELTNYGDGYKDLYYDGSRKSRIDYAYISFEDGCAYSVWSWKK